MVDGVAAQVDVVVTTSPHLVGHSSDSEKSGLFLLSVIQSVIHWPHRVV